MSTTATKPATNIRDLTLSQIYSETCKLVRTISILRKAELHIDGEMGQRLAAMRAEHDRRTCLPMLV